MIAAIHACPRRQDARWMCEQHPDRAWPHDVCAGPGEPCPVCNGANPPDLPPGFVSLVRVED
jgi:hypothetical protein